VLTTVLFLFVSSYATELNSWLKKHGGEHSRVCMEASSTYSEELATYLHDTGHTVSVVNPARIKGFAQSELLRTKNDKVDAGVIARFCHKMRPDLWIPLPPEIRQLQALIRRVDALLGMRTQELNRRDTTTRYRPDPRFRYRRGPRCRHCHHDGA
jgi:transposase